MLLTGSINTITTKAADNVQASVMTIVVVATPKRASYILDTLPLYGYPRLAWLPG